MSNELPPGYTLVPPDQGNSQLPPGYSLVPPAPAADPGQAATAAQAFADQQKASQPATSSDPGWVNWAKTLGAGVGRGVAESPGIVGDLANLGALGTGKLASWVSPEVGKTVQDWALRGLTGQGGLNIGSAGIDKLLDSIHLLEKPEGGSDTVYNIGGILGNTVGAGVTAPARAMVGAGVKALVKGAIADAAKEAITAGGARAAEEYTIPSLARNVAVGTGAGVGAEGAQAAAGALGPPGSDKNPYVQAGAGLAGALLGGGLAGALPGIAGSADPALKDAFKTIGATPRSPTDLGGTGPMSRFFGEDLPSHFGGQKPGQRAAQKTQDELAQGAKGLLGYDPTTSRQDVGTSIQKLAAGRLEELDGIHSSDADQQRLLLQRIMNLDPEEVPAFATENASLGNTRLNQILDLTPTSQPPHGYRPGDLAPGQTVPPEYQPTYQGSAQQKEGLPSQEQLAKQLLGLDATTPEGKFDLNRLMTNLNTLDAESPLPYGLDGDKLQALFDTYNATAQSRARIGQPIKSMTSDPYALAGSIAGGAHAALSGVGVGTPIIAGLEPAATYLGTKLGQFAPGYLASPGAQKMGNVAKGQINAQAPALGTMMAPTYQPPPPQPQAQVGPAPGQGVVDWLARSDQQSVRAFVQQKLGASAAAELAGPNYRAALAQLTARPETRRALGIGAASAAP